MQIGLTAQKIENHTLGTHLFWLILQSWKSRIQRTVALSSTEAEYMALSEAANEAIYLRSFLLDLGFIALSETTIHCDNNGVRKLAENPVFR